MKYEMFLRIFGFIGYSFFFVWTSVLLYVCCINLFAGTYNVSTISIILVMMFLIAMLVVFVIALYSIAKNK